MKTLQLLAAILLVISPMGMSRASQLSATVAAQATSTAPVEVASQALASESPQKFFIRKKSPRAESRTGLYALLLSIIGGLSMISIIVFTVPQAVLILGVLVILASFLLAGITFVQDKGRPRSRQWKMALISLFLGGLPLLLIGLVLLGFYLQ